MFYHDITQSHNRESIGRVYKRGVIKQAYVASTRKVSQSPNQLGYHIDPNITKTKNVLMTFANDWNILECNTC